MRAPAESTRYTTGNSWRSACSVSRTIFSTARAPRPGLHCRVVGHHAHRTTVDAADAGHHTVGRKISCERVREPRVFDERTVVEQPRDALAHEQLVLLRELVGALRQIALPGALGVLLDASELVERIGIVGHCAYVLVRGPAWSSALGNSRPTISRASSAHVSSAPRSIPVSIPMSWHMCTRSSVTAFPDAPGA